MIRPGDINSFQQAGQNPGKVFIRAIRINIMKGPYEFLEPLKRLVEAMQRYERNIFVLNAALLSIAIFCLALVIGLPAFMNFYYQDSPLLEHSPAILSAFLGLAAARLIKRRRRPDIFPLLGGEISEKARTGYDNRDLHTLPMQKLAQDLKAGLNSIKPSMILDSRQIKGRALFLVLLSGAAIIISESEIVNPSDFQALSEIRDKAISAFQDKADEPGFGQEINLTGNIFGKPSLAVLNENKMDLELYPGLGAGSLARSADPVERAFQKSQAGEVEAVASELYIESLPPGNRDIIKRYFMILSEME
jgi:hypothetical protein